MERRTEQASAERKARVLAVDDDPDTARTVRALVEIDGHQCYTANTGADALALCAEHHFDCMFLDARLGALSGLAVAQRLGGSESTMRPTHIVLLSGAPREDFFSALRDRIVDSYLRKPATLENIRSVLDRCLAHH